MNPLVTMARSLGQEMEPMDDLTYIYKRLRTRKQEVMVGTENQHTIIILQDNKVLDASRRNSIAQAQSLAMPALESYGAKERQQRNAVRFARHAGRIKKDINKPRQQRAPRSSPCTDELTNPKH